MDWGDQRVQMYGKSGSAVKEVADWALSRWLETETGWRHYETGDPEKEQEEEAFESSLSSEGPTWEDSS